MLWIFTRFSPILSRFRQNVLIGGFPAEVPVFNAYRTSLSLLTDFKVEKSTEVAAKGFLQKART